MHTNIYIYIHTHIRTCGVDHECASGVRVNKHLRPRVYVYACVYREGGLVGGGGGDIEIKR